MISGLYDTNNPNLYQWKNWLLDLLYDASAQKLSMTLQTPTKYVGYTGQLVEMIPQRMVFEFSGNHAGDQAELAAAIFGGTVNPTGFGWKSEFDTGTTLWFYYAVKGLEDPSIDALLSSGRTY